MVDFLLVIPAYNESERLPSYLEALAKELESEKYSVRILVVDDGSKQHEREALVRAVQLLANRYPFISPPMLPPVNQGKGGAIMTGWSSDCSAKWLSFADADGATPAREVARLFRIAAAREPRNSCFFASRIRLLGRAVERKTARHLMGRVYATLVGCFIHPGIYDSQCGFKIISADTYRSIQDVLSEKRFAFDVELLAALIDAGARIEEVPIDWRDIPGSKVSFVRDTVRMFVSLLRIRARRKRWNIVKATEIFARVPRTSVHDSGDSGACCREEISAL